MQIVVKQSFVALRTALRRLAVACLAAVMVFASAASAGQPAALPPGVAMRLDTSDLASLERAIMFFTNAMLPGVGVGGDYAALDEAFRDIQRSGQMPSLVQPLIQQFFGLPGVEMDSGRGLGMALFIPGEGSDENGGLAFAAWLPVRSFATLRQGVIAGRREWEHIRPLPDNPAILTVADNPYGAGTLYMAASPGGAVMSSTLWGLERATRFWPSGQVSAGNVSGFGIRMAMDFLQPGAELGLAALLEGPVATLIRSMRRENGMLPGDWALYGLLHAMRQAASLDLRLHANPNGEFSVDIDVAAKPAGELAAFLGDAANRSLDGRYLAAMPDNLSAAFAMTGGRGIREFVSGLLREARAGTTGRADELTGRVDDILQGIQLLNSASAGAVATGITLDGCGMAVFDAGDPATAARVTGRMGGLPGVEMRARGGEVIVAVGLEAAKRADAAADGLAGPIGEGALRPGIGRLLADLDDKGVMAFVCYPAELVRIILSYKAREAYMSGVNGDNGNPLDMFAASYIGSLVRNLDSMGPSRYPLSITADAPGQDTLHIRFGFSSLVFSEIMTTYQRAILTFLPGGGSLEGAR